jgi:hypothetical protein
MALPAMLALQGATPPPAPPGLSISHTPPACLVAGESPRLVACAVPRSQVARVRLFFQAEGAPEWHYVEMVSDLPCYTGALPRPSRSTRRVRYVVEATDRQGDTKRGDEHAVEVAADPSACRGKRAQSAGAARVAAFTASGGRGAPAGFEGGPSLSAPPVRPAPSAPPATPVTPPPPEQGRKQGHRGRTVALVLAGGAAAAGGAVVATRGHGSSASSPPAFAGSPGLPPDGIGGRWLGDESITYPSGCVEQDQIVVYIAESGGLVTGTVGFTVSDCRCCARSQGSSTLSGTLSGTLLQFGTVAGFTYSATVSGTRLEGSLAAPGGITGTWRAERR